MAKAYPNSRFYGFDNHPAYIEYARNKARQEGLGEDRIKFEVASSTNNPLAKEKGENDDAHYDLIAFFNCLHDMEDPQGAADSCTKNTQETRWSSNDSRTICKR